MGAKQMFRSLREKFLTLPDYVQVWPGHGAGSACGKALGTVPSSTVGYERLFSWWGRYLEQADEEGFVEALLEGQPDAPVYFGRMKRQNKMGPTLLEERLPPQRYDAASLRTVLDDDEVVFVDTRAPEAFKEGGSRLAQHPSGGELRHPGLLDHRSGEGREADRAAGEGRGRREGPARQAGSCGHRQRRWLRYQPPRIAKGARGLRLTGEAQELGDPFVLDVRAKGEYEAAHIPGATQLHGGRVMWHLHELPRDRRIVVHCQTGTRSAVVASALRAAGFGDVVELEGSYEAYEKTQERTVKA